MKRLFIIRHAKAENQYNNCSDIERTLVEEGIKRTQGIINYIKVKDLQIDCIVSSHAVRAYETSKIIANGLDYSINVIEIDKIIYGCHHSYLVDKVHNFSDNFENVLIVGHNPVITYLVNFFLSEEIDFLPTSGLVILNFDENSWKNVDYTDDFQLVFPDKL